jgi:hypothetical protein
MTLDDRYLYECITVAGERQTPDDFRPLHIEGNDQRGAHLVGRSSFLSI